MQKGDNLLELMATAVTERERKKGQLHRVLKNHLIQTHLQPKIFHAEIQLHSS
jgi:hypothetical protein